MADADREPDNTTDVARPAVASTTTHRRWFLLAGLAVVGIAIVLAWPRWQIHRALAIAKHALAQGDAQAAIDVLERAAKNAPDNAELPYRLAVAHRRQWVLTGTGTWDQATFERYLRRAYDLEYYPEEIHRQQLLVDIQQGRIEANRSDLSRVFDSDPTDEVLEETHEALARGFMASFQLGKAEVALTNWLTFRPQAIQPRLWRALILQQLDRKSEAMELIHEALKESPESYAARLALGRALLADNDPSQALVQVEWCRQIRPHDLDVLILVAECHRSLANVNAARQTLEQALEMNPSSGTQGQILSVLGQIEVGDGNYDRGIQLLAESLKHTPDDLSALDALARAYSISGDTERANRCMAHLTKVRGGKQLIRECVVKLATSPDDPDLRYQFGAVMLGVGNPQVGLEWLESALEADPRHRPTHLLLAEYYERRADPTRAASHRLAAGQSPDPAAREGSAVPKTTSDDLGGEPDESPKSAGNS